jgi:Sodium/hydrogen exchanger family
VLPAYLIGMALAPFFLKQRELQGRMRAICFAFLTPFYFLKAGSLIDAHALLAGAGLIALFLAIKMITKFAGILPLTRYFKFDRREGMYTTLMMSIRSHLRVDLSLVRLDQSHHQPAAIHSPCHGSDRQRCRANANCTALVSPAFRAARRRCLVS